MRILYVLTSLGIGGAERQVIGLAERMVAQGHSAALLVLKGPVSDEWPTAIETHFLNISKNPVSLVRGLWAARWIVNEFAPDVVHSHTFPANMMARMLQLLRPVPVLLSTIHNVYEGGWQRMLAYRGTNFLSRRTTAVSRAAADRFVRWGAVPGDKCIAIPNGIEIDRSANEQDRSVVRAGIGAGKGFVWLAAGRVVAAKDFENLLRSFARVRGHAADTELWIAGDNDTDEAQRLRGVEEELGLRGAVQWLGLRRDLPTVMNAADGFVLSSAWEGMPLVLGEAMGAGKPVVATDVGGVRELVGDAGVVVEAKNSKGLAGAMESVQRMSNEERGAMGAAARERILTHFSMDERAKEWEALYRTEVADASAEKAGHLKLMGPMGMAALVRLALLMATLWRTGTGVITSGDTASYLEPGRRLLVLGEFATAYGPEIDRTPGYPIFVTLASLAGVGWAVVAQICLAVLSVYLVARIGRRMVKDDQRGQQIAVVAAWFIALEPVSIIYSVRLLPETLFALLLLLCLERIVEFLKTERLNPLAIGGLWLVAATYVRPASYYLPAALAIGLACLPMRKARLRWQAPLVLFAVTLPLLGLWQIRNMQQTGFGGFSSILQKNLYFYQAAEVTARVEHRSFLDVQRELGYPDEASYRRQHSEQATWTTAQRIGYEQQEAAGVLRAHPWVYLQTHLTGSAVVAFTPCAADLLRLLGAYPDDAPQRVVNEGMARSAVRLLSAHPGVAGAMALLEAVLLGLYALAVWALFQRSMIPAVAALMLGMGMYFVAVSGGAQAVGRYRQPVMPIICLLAAEGFVVAKASTKRRDEPERQR